MDNKKLLTEEELEQLAIRYLQLEDCREVNAVFGEANAPKLGQKPLDRPARQAAEREMDDIYDQFLRAIETRLRDPEKPSEDLTRRVRAKAAEILDRVANSGTGHEVGATRRIMVLGRQ